MRGEDLTAIQRRVLEFLRERAEGSRELSPTYREIASEFGWRSTATVRDHLRALVRKGYIQLSHGRARAIALNESRLPASYVPILGRVVAGTPVESYQLREAHMAVPANWVRHGRCFAVRVRGDSMKDAAILDGDYVVARAQSVAADGDIVVATLDGETTLKRLTRRGSRWFLAPENTRYRPIPIGSDSVVVQGVMVGLMRSEPVKKTGLMFRPEPNTGRGNEI